MVFLPTGIIPSSEGAQEPTVCDIDPMDLVATIRDDLLDPGLTVRFAHCFSGDAFTRKGAPRDKEG
jgi:hypothetical protein